jgi:hypothetical protein
LEIEGFEMLGLEMDGFEMLGFEIEGLEMDGFEIDGFEMEGFEMLGFEIDGFEMLGLEIDGFEMEGFEMLGFEIDGFEMLGLEIDGFEIDGDARVGLARLTGCSDAAFAAASRSSGSVGSALSTRKLESPPGTGSPPGPAISATSRRIGATGSEEVANTVAEAPEPEGTSVSRVSTGVALASRGASDARPESGWPAIRSRNHRASVVPFSVSTTNVATDEGSSGA